MAMPPKIASSHPRSLPGSMHSLTPAAAAAPAAFRNTGSPNAKTKMTELDASNATPTAAPAWSELKTKAGKERKRLPLACKSCRRKKVRCSGETPSCKHCLRARIPCVYKVTQRKATPRTDYMTMLDKRLKRMEERVIKLIPSSESSKISTIGRASVKPPNADKNKNQSKKRAAMEAFAPSESEDPSKLHPAALKDKSETSSLMEGVEHLPSAEIQEHLAEAYFDFCYGQPYHLLHKPSFMRRLRAGTIPPVLMLAVCSISARFSTHSYFHGEPPSLRGEQWAHEARKIASRSFGEPNMTIVIVVTLLALYDFGSCQGGRAWMYAGIAMRMCYALHLNQEIDHETIEDPEQGPPGVKKKKDKLMSPELSFTDQEIRRRTMWACFLMDCFNSSGTKRPSFDHIPNINVQLPIKEQFFQLEIPGQTEDVHGNPGTVDLPPEDQVGSLDPKENMGVAAYLVKILVLWGRVVQYTNSGRMHDDTRPPWDPQSDFIKLRAKVYLFWKELQPHMRYSAENLRFHEAEKLANQFAFMHIVYQQIILFLHKFTIPAFPGAKLPPQMPDGFRDEARKSAVHAATKISKILEDSRDGQLTAPFACYCTFASSTVHIWGVFSGNKQLQDSCKASLGINMRHLNRMKRYWSMIHYMTESVKDMYKTHADAFRPGLGDSIKTLGNDESFFEYGDMQDREHPPAVIDDAGCKHPSSPPNKNKRFTNLASKSDLESVGDWFSKKSQSPQLLSADIPNRPAKRGKSLHHSKSSTAVSQTAQVHSPNTSPSQSQPQATNSSKSSMPLDAMALVGTPTPSDTASSVNFSHTPRSIPAAHSPPSFPDATAGTQFAVSNPYHDLNIAATFANHMPSGVDGFPRLPMQAFDRQLVYGAYAQDPTLGFDQTPFDTNGRTPTANGAVDGVFGSSGAGLAGMNASTNALDPSVGTHMDLNLGGGIHAGQNMNAGDKQWSGNHGFGDAAGAWLTPFHLVPPINLVQPEYTASGQADGMGFGNMMGANGDGSGSNNGGLDFWNT